MKIVIHQSKTCRGLAFLIDESDNRVNAKKVFDELPEKQSVKRERELRTRFDYWLDDKVHDKWFHGWPNNKKYKNCFVFKWKHRRLQHRIYGFLCNPKMDDPRYQLCVLVSHAKKNEWETNPPDLDRIVEISNEKSVKLAIKKLFPKKQRGKKK